MKKWIRPEGTIEQFEANEYVAACNEQNLVYKFKCDAGSKNEEYHVYLNGPDGKAHTRDDIDWSARSGALYTFTPCGIEHDAKTTDDFYNGYMYEVGYRGENTGRPINVVVWTDGGTNTHCTKELNKDEWTTDRS